MCGFVAVLSSAGVPDAGMLARMTDLLAHRGPDATGMFAEHSIALGFRRLAILDPAPSGHQPMLSRDGRHVLVFNGEIYNFIELRRQLEALGHTFASSGDTEVLLAAYRQWGRECLQRLNGMWAFLIYDRVERRLFGARDRFGVKPLFWYRDGAALVFTSEIKAIRDSGYAPLEVDWQTLASCLLEGRLDTDQRTFYQGVARVPAGYAFECDATGNLAWWRYWSLTDETTRLVEPQEPVAHFRDLFDDAVAARMRSDVPLGVQLSGGLDSTSIMASMAGHLRARGDAPNELHAFCYMDPEFDESAMISATLEQTRARLTVLDSTPEQLWDSMETHLWYQDEPVHSFTSVVGFHLMALARSRGVKVLLNGQGADEVLAGYPNYFNDYWAELIRLGRWWRAAREMSLVAGPSRSALGTGVRALRSSLGQVLRHLPGYDALVRGRQRSAVAADPWVSAAMKEQWRPAAARYPRRLDDVLRDSVETGPLPLYLRVEDRNSMAHGVEVRLPFLDYRLVTLAFRLGACWKLADGRTKVLLREAMAGRIPEIVRSRTRKLGFPTGIDSWLRHSLHGPLRDLLASRVVRESGIWNLATVESALEAHRQGSVNLGSRLFDVAQICLWIHGSRAWPQAPLRKPVGYPLARHAPLVSPV
jgi:asparagine synthase (glutamine-hydrolysing)